MIFHEQQCGLLALPHIPHGSIKAMKNERLSPRRRTQLSSFISLISQIGIHAYISHTRYIGIWFRFLKVHVTKFSWLHNLSLSSQAYVHQQASIGGGGIIIAEDSFAPINPRTLHASYPPPIPASTKLSSGALSTPARSATAELEILLGR